MTPSETTAPAILKVIDTLDHPHGNRILRTRVLEGIPPTVGKLKNSWLLARGPDGTEVELRVVGFPVFGGKLSDARIRSTGRVDLVIGGNGDVGSISRAWKLYRIGPKATR